MRKRERGSRSTVGDVGFLVFGLMVSNSPLAVTLACLLSLLLACCHSCELPCCDSFELPVTLPSYNAVTLASYHAVTLASHLHAIFPITHVTLASYCQISSRSLTVSLPPLSPHTPLLCVTLPSRTYTSCPHSSPLSLPPPRAQPYAGEGPAVINIHK